jgi:hypothetical protein
MLQLLIATRLLYLAYKMIPVLSSIVPIAILAGK